jgi:hypothetical protein
MSVSCLCYVAEQAKTMLLPSNMSSMLMPCVSKDLGHFCVLVRRHVVLSC